MFGLFLKISNSISHIHALLTYFVVVFVISEVFASFLGNSIAFPWSESCYTMIRVSVNELGFLYTGKIGPRDLYHRVRNDLRNRTMPLEFIYFMCAGFLIVARDIASSNGRR